MSINGSKGITLTEVLFSAAVIGLVLGGILMIFVNTIDISKKIDLEYTATNLARNRLERARSIMATNGFDFLANLAETDSIINSSGVPDADGDFKRSTDITSSFGGNVLLTRIDVSVAYRYRDDWKDDIATVINALLTNIED